MDRRSADQITFTVRQRGSQQCCQCVCGIFGVQFGECVTCAGRVFVTERSKACRVAQGSRGFGIVA
jgi:hypothetical protein